LTLVSGSVTSRTTLGFVMEMPILGPTRVLNSPDRASNISQTAETNWSVLWLAAAGSDCPARLFDLISVRPIWRTSSVSHIDLHAEGGSDTLTDALGLAPAPIRLRSSPRSQSISASSSWSSALFVGSSPPDEARFLGLSFLPASPSALNQSVMPPAR